MIDTELTPKTVEEWYKPICDQCSYFVNESKRIDIFGISMGVRCERPNRFSCLGLSPFVQRIAMWDHIMQQLTTSDVENKQKTKPRMNFNGVKRFRGIYKRKKR